MSSTVIGEVDWNSADSAVGGKSDFMRLQQGENTVRVMGNPIQFYIHWLNTPAGGKKKVNSPTGDPALVKRLEDSGFKRQPRWFIKILDRADESFKILEVGPQIYNAVKALVNNARWGKVTQYDITIIRGPDGTSPLYSVTPNPKEAIPAELKTKFVDFNDRVNIDKLIAPAQAKDVCEPMGWPIEKPKVAEAAKSTAPAATEEDFDFNFE